MHRSIHTIHRTCAFAAISTAAIATALFASGTHAAAMPPGGPTSSLLARLDAAGGEVSADGRWVVMPDRARVLRAPAVFADCPSLHVCLWDNASYTGTMVDFGTAAASFTNLGVYGFDNRMTSWGNRSASRDARWFYNTGLSGTSRCMNSATGNSNVGATDNDQASSLQIYTDTAAC